ncbi:Lethal(3)malignant brain tumor-like protein 1, partial [Eschrichtius robustus]|nr:Lethal(3)malignant brain tumor-like protein 1 [Eschrichtius robustus]
YPDPDSFCWEKYLEETGASAVPTWAFKVRPPHSFLVNMKLEAVDRRNPALIRVASVEDVEDHRMKDPENPALPPLGAVPLSAVEACHRPGPPSTAFTTGKFTAHHCLSGCPLAERNQSRLKAELSDTEALARKRNLSGFSLRKKPRHHSRIGRPPKYQKIPQEDFPTLTTDVMHQSLFMSALSAHPDRSLSACWEQHCRLLPGVAGISASTVAKWTINEVFGFVQTLTGCEDQARLFKDEMIDGEAFLLLTQADIVKIMSVKLGPALKIYNAILMFKNADDTLNPGGDLLSQRQLGQGSHSAPPAELPQGCRRSSEALPSWKGSARPCLGLGVGFTEAALRPPWPGVRRSELSLSLLVAWVAVKPTSSVASSAPCETGERCSLTLVGGEDSKYTQLCCGASPLLRSAAGMAVPCGSVHHHPNACLQERQGGPRALEKRAPRPPNLEASALSAPTSNSGKKPNHKKGGKKSAFCPPRCPFTPIPSPDEIIAP